MHNSKARGNAYERAIAQELREFFPNIKTSRSESKNMDDAKIDLVDPDGIMPFYPQIKLTQKTPDYFGIERECPYKDKPFVVFWNKTRPTESTFRSEGQIVMIPKSFFYQLIEKYVKL